MQGLIVFIIILLVCWVIFSKAFAKREPKVSTFRCADCTGLFDHNDRTKAILRKNQHAKLYCKACFGKHTELHRHSAPDSQYPAGNSSSKAGCLGFIVLFTLIPLGFFIF